MSKMVRSEGFCGWAKRAAALVSDGGRTERYEESELLKVVCEMRDPAGRGGRHPHFYVPFSPGYDVGDGSRSGHSIAIPSPVVRRPSPVAKISDLTCPRVLLRDGYLERDGLNGFEF